MKFFQLRYSVVKWVLPLVIIFNGLVSYAQHPSFYKLGEEELNGIDIYDLAQDRVGNYWIASDLGLIKFDGYSFSNIPSTDLLSNSLFELKSDYSGNTYCKNLSGQIFKIENDTLKLFFEVPDSLMSSVIHFDFDNRNCLLVSSKQLILKPENEEFQILKASNWRGAHYTEFTKLEDSTLMFFNTTSSEFLYFKNNTLRREPVSSPHSKSVFHPYQISGKNYFYESEGGLLYKKKGGAMKLKTESNVLYDGQLKRFNTDGENIWMALYSGGVQVFNLDLKKLYNGNILLKNTIISAFFKDKAGNLILGTFGEGLVVFPNSKLINLTFENPLERISKVTSNGLGDVFLGSQSGKIFKVDTLNNISVLIEGQQKNIELLDFIPEQNGILYDAKEPMFFDLKSHKSLRKLHGSIKDVEKFKDSLYIIAANTGVYKFSPSYFVAQQVSPFDYRSYCVNRNPINNWLYVGTSKGLMVKNDSLAFFIELDGKTIKCNDIKSYKDSVFVATHNQGILVYIGYELVEQWNEKTGLLSNTINQIQFLGENLYLGTSKGFQIVDLNGETKTIIGKSEGLGANNIIDFEISNQKLWLVHQKGVQWMDINKYPQFDITPTISIANMKVNDSIVLINQKIELRHMENKVSFEVRSSILRYSSEIKYKFKLENIEKDWQIQPYSQNKIEYKSLPPGNYTFKVKAVCRNVESETQTVQFSISYPFWRTWWFYLLCALFFVFITAIVFKIQTDRHNKKVQLQNELNASKLIAIQSQMNPHFIFNAINSIQDLILKGDIDNSYSYIIKFSKLVRQTLNFSDKEFIDIEEEIDLLKIYLELEKLRFDESFHYEIESENCEDIRVPPMLVQPIVENAIKHGLLHKKGDKKLTIRFLKKEKLACIVQDNGIGRQKAKEIKERQNKGHQSFSVSAIKNRFEIMQSQYNTEIGVKYDDLQVNGIPAGTKVEINMPFEKKY